MEITRLTATKLKVALTRDDMAHYDIDTSMLGEHSPHTRRVFRSILDEAQKQTGFDAAKERVSIRVYPMPGGGCDMYITLLCAKEVSEDAADLDDLSSIGEEIPAEACSSRSPLLGEDTVIYTGSCPPVPRRRAPAEAQPAAPVLYALEAEDISSVITLCAVLQARGYAEKSDLYAARIPGETHRCRFYLCTRETVSSPQEWSFTDLLCEYGTPMASFAVCASLPEHADCIRAGDAIQTLAALAT